MRTTIIALTFLLFSSAAFSQTQTSFGDCSPNIGVANGIVIINCGIRQTKSHSIAQVVYEHEEISFYEHNLYAYVDGLKYKVLNPEIGLFWIIEDGDFDNDGYNDALVGWSCGGNGCPSRFLIVSYRGSGVFKIAEHEKFLSWNDPVVLPDGAKSVFRVDSVTAGSGNTSEVSIMSIFSLNRGKLILIEEGFASAEVPSVVELRSSIYKDGLVDKANKIHLMYDLNGDQKLDALRCHWWERWGLLSCSIETSTGILVGGIPGCNRVGILSTTTSGMSDLVCDRDVVLRFNRENENYETQK